MNRGVVSGNTESMTEKQIFNLRQEAVRKEQEKKANAKAATDYLINNTNHTVDSLRAIEELGNK